jgi:hypothetical protein
MNTVRHLISTKIRYLFEAHTLHAAQLSLGLGCASLTQANFKHTPPFSLRLCSVIRLVIFILNEYGTQFNFYKNTVLI